MPKNIGRALLLQNAESIFSKTFIPIFDSNSIERISGKRDINDMI
jgi:hypothetical protein